MQQQEQLRRIVECLPSECVQQVLDFAKSLAEKVQQDDNEWDRMVADPKYAPKLRALLTKCEKEISEGRFKPIRCK